jgi:hypothetical protein
MDRRAMPKLKGHSPAPRRGEGDREAVGGARRGAALAVRPLHHFAVPLPRCAGEDEIAPIAPCGDGAISARPAGLDGG